MNGRIRRCHNTPNPSRLLLLQDSYCAWLTKMKVSFPVNHVKMKSKQAEKQNNFFTYASEQTVPLRKVDYIDGDSFDEVR